jgi:NAD(P)-dependent dehydrogenase (short-subunit alcohol dehydrogenase family)
LYLQLQTYFPASPVNSPKTSTSPSANNNKHQDPLKALNSITMTTKVALITASSAGLGAAIAKALIPTYSVVINYSSNASRAQSVLDSLSKLSSSNKYHAIQADLSSPIEINRLVNETVAKFGRLDVVVSNGGWTKMTNFMDLEDNLEEEVWDRCFNFNVKSHLWLMHAAKKHLEETEGSFLTTASVAGIKPSGSSLVCRGNF